MVQLRGGRWQRLVPDIGLDVSFRKEGLVAHRIAACMVLSHMQAPVDVYIHHGVRITEQAGVCAGESGYLFTGHGQHRVPAHVLQDTHRIVHPFEKGFQLSVVFPVQMFLIGQG